MDAINELLNAMPKDEKDENVNIEEIMGDPEYLRSSSEIISDALQKGHDVLQLENGDIVTTGTKVIVTQFHWDVEKQKMVKLSSKEQNPGE